MWGVCGNGSLWTNHVLVHATRMSVTIQAMWRASWTNVTVVHVTWMSMTIQAMWGVVHVIWRSVAVQAMLRACICDLMSVIIQACVGSLYMWSEGVWLYELCLYMWPEWVWPYKLCGELYRSNMNKCDCRSLYIWPEWVWPYKLCGELVHVIWRSVAVRAILESLYMWPEWVWPYKLCGELYTSNMNRNLYMWPEWAWPYKLCGELIYTCDLKECGCTSYVWELVYVTWMSVVIQAMWGACTVFGRSVLPYVGSFCTWSEWTYKLCLGACAFYDLLQSIVGHVFVALCVIF